MSDGLPPHLRALGLPPDLEGGGVSVALFDAGVCAVDGLRDHLQSCSPEGTSVIGEDLPDHATRCASLIASRHPSAPGVAPGVALISVEVIDREKRAVDPGAVARAFEFARLRAFDIVCCCFVLPEIAPQLATAVRAYLDGGGLVVGAAGNSPARRRFPFVRSIEGALVARAAEAAHDTAPGEIRAPGEHLPVLTRRGAVDPNWRGQSSGAGALVAGVVALALSAEPAGAPRRKLAAEMLRRLSTCNGSLELSQMVPSPKG